MMNSMLMIDALFAVDLLSNVVRIIDHVDITSIRGRTMRSARLSVYGQPAAAGGLLP